MKNLVVAGLFTSFIASGAVADMYYQGFEDPLWDGGQYTDASGLTDGHWLNNNVGESWVNGPGFNAWVAGDGLADGDWLGVTDYTGGIGSWYEGSQGYQISDTDGVFELHFDGYEGNADTVSLAIFIAATGWEAADNFSIHWGSDPVNGTLYSLDGNDGDGNGSTIEDASGTWMFLELDVSSLGSGHLHIRTANNSGSEVISIDSVSIMGSLIPTPGALALLGLAGIASRRRRK
jgi:hypothetical protein